MLRGGSSQTDILFVIGALEIGGTERHLLNLSAQLRKANWRVAIYSLAGEGPLKAELESAGVRVIVPPIARAAIPNSLLARGMRLALAAVHLTYTMERMQPQIVHFFLPAAYIIGAIAAKLTRMRVRVMSRRSLNNYQRAFPFVRTLEMKLHGSMNAILGNSRAVIHQLCDEEGVSLSKLGLIYNGIELPSPASRSVVRSSLGIDENVLVYIVVANLIPYKGHLDLIQAFGIADSRIGRPWRLLLVGRDDGIGADIRNSAERLGIADKVIIMGVRTDVACLLSASDVGALCSHQEGFSNAIIEGMAAGLPMIVTDVGGNSEAVIDGQCGFVVPPRNPEQLAAAIERLAGNPDMRVTMGSNANERARDSFTLAACVARYKDLYAALLAGREPCEISSIRID